MSNVVKIFTPQGLTQEQLEKIEKSIVKIFGKKDYEYKIIIEPELIAGIKIKYGSKVVDLTVLTKLLHMKNNLLNA